MLNRRDSSAESAIEICKWINEWNKNLRSFVRAKAADKDPENLVTLLLRNQRLRTLDRRNLTYDVRDGLYELSPGILGFHPPIALLSTPSFSIAVFRRPGVGAFKKLIKGSKRWY